MSVSPYNMIRRTIAQAEKRISKKHERHHEEMAALHSELATLKIAEEAMRPAPVLPSLDAIEEGQKGGGHE